MKKLILVITLFVGLGIVAKAQTAAPAGEFKFATESYDFGKIPQGTPVTHVFTFTNSGNAPIIITNAEATCGCTKPEYSQTPIKPGGKGEIKVTFNAAANPAPFSKSITVTSNARTTTKVLYIKGEIVAQTASK